MSSTIYIFILCVVNQSRSNAWKEIIYATMYNGFRSPFLLKVLISKDLVKQGLHAKNNSFGFILLFIENYAHLLRYVKISLSVYDVLFTFTLSNN